MNLQELRKLNFEITKKGLREAVTRDVLVMQCSHTITELDGIINKLIANLRERYGYYAPRVSREADNNALLGAIHEFIKEDMGVSLNEKDIKSIKELSFEIEELIRLKNSQEGYISGLMDEICPSLKKEAGILIGAQLICIAGSLKHLAELPSSTIQVLGAEKALFRHIKTGAKPPRFGVIFSHELISNAKENEKGKAARKLASKISIAVKMDYFKDKK